MNDRKVDQILVEHTRQGEQKAFRMLMSKYQRHLFRPITRFVKDEHDIDDVAQEAMIKAYRALPGFRGESAPYTRPYRIAINTARNFLTTSGKRPFVSVKATSEEGDVLGLSGQVADYHTPEAEVVNQEILQTAEAAISELPDDLRKAITLKEIDGLSYEETAQIMDCPINTVRSRIFRAHEVIVKDLRPLLDASKNQR